MCSSSSAVSVLPSAARSIDWPPVMPIEPQASGDQPDQLNCACRGCPRCGPALKMPAAAVHQPRVSPSPRRTSDVHGRFAAAQVVVVHGGQVVVHQRERMNQFDGDGGRVEMVRSDTQAFAGCVDEQGPYPLAAVEDRIAHSIVKSFRREGCRRERFVQALVHAPLVVRYPVFKLVGQRAGSCVVGSCSLHRNESLCARPAGL